jgi:hypothetical protein
MIDENIYLFVGLTSTLIGIVLLIYTLGIWVTYRRQIRDNGLPNTQKSIDDELNIKIVTMPVSRSSLLPGNTSTDGTRTYQAPSSIQPVQSMPTVNSGMAPMPQPPAQQQQWIVELENLILQHAMGLIQPDVYQQRKQELMRKSQSGSMTTTSLPTQDQDTDKAYTSHEELLIDYAEGIITAREYEQQKIRFMQKSEPMS